ncbi:selenocysteine lyase/cysteine desulfurase [Paenibacillus forsythiae]|uniref:Selenocysteine lyase/cysteine desulfurase n=2 Tax=Paenibacillus forsythiae TaxID=365616 RepID=A0ABU3H3T1_9BACL|nr:aminotransferase class V-fold PLP-dependent enzyme [Paenibacillus forsythiae]MDT3425482.1 selenocysteine lyase/cysteine desulfurase [Paenibacillus forsythiae]
MLKSILASSAEEADSLEAYFSPFREHTIGLGHPISTPYGKKPLLYADWTASGRLYEPIERRIQERFGPFIGNPHTEANATGMTMTRAYEEAGRIIKRHVNAGPRDILLTCGFGMTAAVNKLQRLLGLRLPEWMEERVTLPPEERPVIFVTHMEHHSNLLPWQECIGEVVVLPPGPDGNAEPRQLEAALRPYRGRRLKIGSFTACSNVTGIETPYRDLAAVMHRHGGLCFVDFAASAPYTGIDMHPPSPLEKLDAIFFSPHKFLGGPGSGGVLIFDAALYGNRRPDEPGGGTVSWVSPWEGPRYSRGIEAREDGGTPGFLQAIRTALSLRLKERMTTQRILRQERALCRQLLDGLQGIPEITVLEGDARHRLGIVSLTVRDMHYNLVVRLLNDRFGIQARGGCSCAGPYGHYLLSIGREASALMSKTIQSGDQSLRPGWVRLSLHPVMTSADVAFILSALKAIVGNREDWQADYRYNPATNCWRHRSENGDGPDMERLFAL